MKKDYRGTVIGIVLVLVVALGAVSFFRVQNNKWMKQSKEAEGTDTPSDGRILKIPSWEEIPSWAEKGYTKYQDLPEAYQKLVESKIFVPSKENAANYEFWEEEGDDDFAGEEYMGELQQEYEEFVTSLGMAEDASFLKEESSFVLSPVSSGMTRKLKWKEKEGKFDEAELFAAIEDCGFSGFSNLMSEVEDRIRNQRSASAEDRYYTSTECIVYCGGGTFVVRDSYDDQYYELSVIINYSRYYIPEKYRNMIDRVNADGDYFLYSSCVGGKKEVLVFCRDNTVCELGRMGEWKNQKTLDNKRLAFVFEEGKLVDYYVVTATDQLQLDGIDQKMLDTYASGLGKTLSDYGETGDLMSLFLYRAE